MHGSLCRPEAAPRLPAHTMYMHAVADDMHMDMGVCGQSPWVCGHTQWGGKGLRQLQPGSRGLGGVLTTRTYIVHHPLPQRLPVRMIHEQHGALWVGGHAVDADQVGVAQARHPALEPEVLHAVVVQDLGPHPGAVPVGDPHGARRAAGWKQGCGKYSRVRQDAQ